MNRPSLPPDAELLRTTATFDNDSVPAALLRKHRIADGLWGRLVVHTGTLHFVFDGECQSRIRLDALDTVVIPHGLTHHVELDAPATFAIEFYRAKTSPPRSLRRPPEHGVST